MPEPYLPDRVALVTGSSRQLGATIARRLAAEGASVALNYLQSREEALALARELRRQSVDAAAFKADVTKPRDLARLADAALEKFGHVDILVHNAGPWTGKTFAELSEQEYDYIMDGNVKAAWWLAQRLAPQMQERGWGRIVTIGATSAYKRNHGVYGMAKAALTWLTEALALELAPAVTVNCVAPGWIAYNPASPATRRRILHDTPLRHLVTDEEIAEAVAFLCSPACAAVTGHTLVMDGGRALPRD